MTVGLDPGGSARLDVEYLRATLRDSRALRHMSRQAIARARATRDAIHRGRSQREILRDSAFARLRARQATMAVIEQAKGVLMAQHRCGPDEAFDLLRRASQRANVKLNVLAARIVEHVAAESDGGNVTPIAPRRHQVPADGNAGTGPRRLTLTRAPAP